MSTAEAGGAIELTKRTAFLTTISETRFGGALADTGALSCGVDLPAFFRLTRVMAPAVWISSRRLALAESDLARRKCGTEQTIFR